jgi:signal transduction histidine kinase
MARSISAGTPPEEPRNLMNEHSKGTDPTRAQRTLWVLLVEDSEPDAFLVLKTLERGGFRVHSQRVQSAEETKRALQARKWDLILADHAMPGFSAPEALELLKARDLDVPFIIVSGFIDEETAVAAMRAGAHDYIMKGRLARLVPAVERELREAEMRDARRKSEEDLRRAHEELEERVESRTAALKEANLKLQSMFEERRRLENELLEIAENERRRIGFDLHDDLGQKLTGAGFMAKGLQRRLEEDKHPCAAEACKVHALIEEITTHAHHLARQFSSLDAQGDDLMTVLKSLVGHVKKMFEVVCGLTITGQIPSLPQNAIMQLYKICQEAVSNSIKHGKAKHVAISLAAARGELTLSIRNDGLPFDPDAGSKNRMGLRIMNYRANTIGARLEIKPLPKGTLVTCSLPCKASAAKPSQKGQPGPKSRETTETRRFEVGAALSV